MAQHTGTRLHAGLRLDLLGQLVHIDPNALCHNDQKVLFVRAQGALHPLNYILLNIELDLRNQNCGSAYGNAGVQRQITGTTPHHLNHHAAVVALGRIANTIHHLHNGVHTGIIPNGIVTASNIVIDRSGQTHTGNTSLGQITGPTERTVAADDHDTLNAVLTANANGLAHTLFRSELHAAGRIELGAAPMNNIRNRTQIHLHKIAVDQTVIATNHA